MASCVWCSQQDNAADACIGLLCQHLQGKHAAETMRDEVDDMAWSLPNERGQPLDIVVQSVSPGRVGKPVRGRSQR